MLSAIFKAATMVVLLILFACAVFIAGEVFAQGPAGPLIPAQPAPGTDHFEPPDHVSSHALNWAGYIATGHTYSSVSGSWIVPHVADSAGNVADATWVGIGGAVSDDLIQAGTEVVPDDTGNLVYQAWYELLPDNSKPVPLPISPGDVVSVAVTEQSPGQWLISFTDATTGQSYTKTVQYDSTGSSADWIEEMPVEVDGVMRLDDFGAIHFSAGYAIADGKPVSIARSGARPIVMDNSDGSPVAIPSKLDGASGFTVARTNAESSPLAISHDDQHAVPVDDIGSAYTARIYDITDPETLRIILMQF